ncbi:MAG: DUF2232 domain-containing protein [Ruminococcaceae bacterium]|nr:DUF2232 domain-containing protein [Oscillospiraceae bacterium]
MNDTTSFGKSENPWLDSSLPPMQKRFAVVTAIVFFLSSLCLTLCVYEWGVILLFVALFAYVIWIARSPKIAVWVLSGAIFLILLSSTLLLGTLFLSMVVGCMSGAFLLTTRRLPLPLIAALPVVAIAVSVAVTGSIGIALCSVAFVPASILLAVATRRHFARTSVLCFAIGGFLLTAGIALAALVYDATGSLSRDSLQHCVEVCRNGLMEFFVQLRTEVLALIAETDAGEEGQKLQQEISTALSDDTLRAIIRALFNLLPAILTVVAAVIAFLGQILLLSSYHTAGLDRVLTPKARTLTVSLSAAIIFLVCFLLLFILPDSMALAVVQNICLILTPILLLVGVQTLVAMITKAKGAMKILLILGVGAMVCCFSGGMLLVLAAWGAYNRIAVSIQQKIYEKMGQGPKGPSDPER